MLQMERAKKMKSIKVGKRKGFSLRSRTQINRNAYNVLIVTEKGEKLTYRVRRRHGICKIDEKGGVPYTHMKIIGALRVNARITLYSQEGGVNGTIQRVTALGPSTDVEPGDTPPIKRPGGH